MLELRNKQFWSQWAPLALRLVIGYGFLVHGLAKLGRGPQKFAGVLGPALFATVLALTGVATFSETRPGRRPTRARRSSRPLLRSSPLG